jgi:hypothetical protein
MTTSLVAPDTLLGCLKDVQNDPINSLPYYRLADACRLHGDSVGWRRALEMAFVRRHDTYEQLYFRARGRLTLSDWRGWTDYEARCFGPFFSSQHRPRALRMRWISKKWNGDEDISNLRIFVQREQGFGDSIQMLRFLPWLAAHAREVIVAVKPSLVEFARYNFGPLVKIWVDDGDMPTMGYDRYTWIMSLPGLAGHLPAFRPLVPPPSVHAPLTLNRDRGLLAGICWAGAPRHVRDRTRSISFATLKPLLTRRDTSWFSLQVGDREADADAFLSLHRPQPALATFADTARLICQMDYVVTVDTAVAHLAGSLGVPTYVLLPIAATWRWGLGVSTPWYPTMRLIRQERTGDWAAPINEVSRLLDRSRPMRTISG